MNWLDLLLLIGMAVSAFKGYQRGLIIELASLAGLVLGIWAALRISDKVMAALGLDLQAHWAFIVTLILVVLAVHLLARFLTTLMDIAQLGLPNKLAGVLFGVLRSAFVFSILLNLLVGLSDGAMPGAATRNGSRLYAPLRAFAPLALPVLGETKWVKDAAQLVRREVEEMVGGPE